METTATPGWSDPLALRAACECGNGVTRLEGDFRRLLERLHQLGPVMALTRNEDVVHEKIGRYENVSADGMVGLALGEDIDLRLFFQHWKCSPQRMRARRWMQPLV